MLSSPSSSSSSNDQPRKRRRGRPRLPLIRFVTDRSPRECRWCGQIVVNDEWIPHWDCRSKKLREVNGEVYACLRKGCHFMAPEPRFLLAHATEDVPCPNIYTNKYGELWNESKDSRELVVRTSHVWLVNSPANSDKWLLPRDFPETSKPIPSSKSMPSRNDAGQHCGVSSGSDLTTSNNTNRKGNQTLPSKVEAADKRFQSYCDRLGSNDSYVKDDPSQDEAEISKALQVADEEEEDEIAQKWSHIDQTAHSSFERLTQDFIQGCPVRLSLKNLRDTNNREKTQLRLENVADFADFISSSIVDLTLGHEKYLAKKQSIHTASANLVQDTAQDGNTVEKVVALQRLEKTRLQKVCIQLQIQNKVSSNVHEAADVTVSAMFGPSLPKARQILRNAASQNHAFLYQITTDMDMSVLAEPSQISKTCTFHLRDPVVLAFNILSSPKVFARGEAPLFESSRTPKAFENPQDGLRFAEMQEYLRAGARKLKTHLEKQNQEGLSQFSESQKAAWKSFSIDTDLCPLPLIFYIDDEKKLGKSSQHSACPIVMSVLALPTSALQRHSAKRVIGFLSIPNFDSGMELARSRYKQELCEIMRVTLVEIIKTWQTVAIRKGGLILRHGVDTIRCIPMVGFVMGDYKEFTNLSCTLPNTRCHFCCTSMKPVSSEIAVPRHKRSEIMALRKDPDEIPKAVNTRFDALPSPVHSPKTHTDHPSDQIGSLETSKDVFGDEPADRLVPYDLLRTFYLGPSRDALIAAIWCGNLGNTSNFRDLKVKLSKRSGSIPYLGLQGVKLQDYLHEAGHLEHNCLERKLQAKDIMPLFRGIVTAFIHDSLFPYEGRKLDLSMNFRSIVWTLASFVVVGHELERQSQPQGALPILRENIDKAVHVANTYRVQLEEKPTSSLFLPQLHALRHLSEMIMHTGGIGVLDNDHFDQYSLSTKRIIAQVGNVDDKSLHKLWRCIELDVASDFMPELPPVRLPRCQFKGAHTNFAACSAASLAKQILQHLASTFHQNVAHRSAGLERSILSSFAEESSTGESENSASPRFESYKNATMRTRRLNAWGSADKASELPTVLLSEAGDLFAPLEFIQKQNTKKRECPSNPNFCIAVQIEIDSLSHSKLAHKTYRQQQLCGFRIANGDRVNVANIVCRNIEEFACCYVFKLRPNNPSCKLLVCWPAGETAPSNWTSSPFFQDYLPTPKQPLDDFDDTERCQTRLEEHHYKDLGQKNVENIKANRSRLV